MISMVDPIKSDFHFIGKRNYIQGHVQLGFTLTALRKFFNFDGVLPVKHFKQFAEVSQNVILTTESQHDNPIVSELVFQLKETWMHAFLVSTSDSIIKIKENFVMPVRIDGPVDEFSGSGSIDSVASFQDVLASIIEINKQIHQTTLPPPAYAPQIRVVSIGKFHALEFDRNTALSVQIKLKQKRKFQGRMYTLSQVRWTLGKEVHPMELCFAFSGGDL